jgi:hypothetical protein
MQAPVQDPKQLLRRLINELSIGSTPESADVEEGLIEKLEIIDMKGAVVYTSTENKKEHVLPVSLESGFFVVLLQTENGTFRKELVIQR